MKVSSIFCTLLLLTACASNELTTAKNIDILEISVGSQRVDCVGLVPMRCLVVDGQYFYDEITGFDHKNGVSYRLKVKRTKLYNNENAPADASQYSYTLVEIIEAQPD